MYLLDCPRCRGVTLHPDDSAGPACRWCGWWGRPPQDHLADDPAAVRRFVLADLRPVVTLFALVGVAHCVVAAMLLFYFTSLNNLVTRFHDPPRAVLVVAVIAVILVSGVFILAAGVAVRTGRGRLLAVVGAWLVLTSPLLLGLPVGIWAVRKLTRPEAQVAFARRG